MKPAKISTALLSLALLALSGTSGAVTKTYQQPPDVMPLKASTLPGFARAQAVCGNCHSAEYLYYQPPTAARPYWDTMVKRMKAVFKAPLADEDVPLIVDYLVKTYGNEQPK